MLMESACTLQRLSETIYVAVSLEVCDMWLGNFSNVRQEASLDTLAHRIVFQVSKRSAITDHAVGTAAFARNFGARIALDKVDFGIL